MLDLLGPDEAVVSGFPFMGTDEVRKLDPRALCSKILCERHNNALSPLDALAGKFFRFVLDEKPAFTELVIRGYELERWLLKALCAVMATGLATVGGQRLSPILPKRELLETLFERADISDGRGLSYLLEDHAELVQINSLHFYPMAAEPIGVFGLGVRIGYLRLIFSLGQIATVVRERDLPGIIYRPSCIVIDGNGPLREIHFGWPEGKVAYLNVRQRNGNEAISPE